MELRAKVAGDTPTSIGSARASMSSYSGSKGEYKDLLADFGGGSFIVDSEATASECGQSDDLRSLESRDAGQEDDYRSFLREMAGSYQIDDEDSEGSEDETGSQCNSILQTPVANARAPSVNPPTPTVDPQKLVVKRDADASVPACKPAAASAQAAQDVGRRKNSSIAMISDMCPLVDPYSIPTSGSIFPKSTQEVADTGPSKGLFGALVACSRATAHKPGPILPGPRPLMCWPLEKALITASGNVSG